MQYYINKEDLQYFVYDNILSHDFGIIVTKTNQLSSPERNIEIVEANGRDEPLLIDKGNYKPFKLELECYIDSENKNIHEVSRSIKKWLQGEFRFKSLIFSDDPEYFYEAVCINKLDIDEIIELLGEFKLTFLCKPLKKQVGMDLPLILTENNTIYNEGLVSKPYIRVVGNGNITININTQSLVLKDVEGFIEVDTELYNCFKDKVNQNNKMYSDFPYLEEGINNISWIGNVNRLEIVPRWVVL